MYKEIIKRDGLLVKFDAEKITSAIAKSGLATGEFDPGTARKLTIKVLSLAEILFEDSKPSVEEI